MTTCGGTWKGLSLGSKYGFVSSDIGGISAGMVGFDEILVLLLLLLLIANPSSI